MVQRPGRPLLVSTELQTDDQTSTVSRALESEGQCMHQDSATFALE